MDTNRNNTDPLDPGAPAHGQENPQKKQATASRAAMKAAAFAGGSALGIARYLLFFTLSTLRGPIRFLCALFTFCAIIGLPIAFFGLSNGDPMRASALIFFGVSFFAASAVSWGYDALLIRLSPRPLFMQV